ncbi:glutamate-rich protein 5 [Bombina bombina]|uniref:glutamate-rich protein 5 n=1 Tax=Bombina bombina TaxID=8345 RepID=UPI00235A504F|nr:glutamate-rich protein 5 [Bombina bombina]
MGCSSSTQTHAQGSNRPPAKTVETNGPKKSDTSDVSDQIIDDVETIPDQTKLVPMTENEASDEAQQVEDNVEAIEAVELEASEVVEPVTEDYAPAEEKPDLVPTSNTEDTEAATDVYSNQDDTLADGETEDALEAEMQEEIASEQPETMEEETGHSMEAAEINTTDIEE